MLETHHASRLVMGPLSIDSLTFEGAIDAIEELVASGRGGTVFTPNVDHVVLATQDSRMRGAYARASLSLVDGTPLVWASRLLGAALPGRISGSELVVPLLRRAALCGWRVYLLGAAPGVAAMARERLRALVPGLNVVGVDAARVDIDEPAARREAVLAPIRAARPDLVLVALGAPKQEIWIDEVRQALRPAVLVGVGASLDFVAGTMPRAPAWMSRAGLEWFFRLSREPRRLGYRYLVRDPQFLLVLLRSLGARATSRALDARVRPAA
jgi:N-acetylglucosaminyldiphosphoundecaprenol N-acetyl-beta-D-mannosaminyltransferase